MKHQRDKVTTESLPKARAEQLEIAWMFAKELTYDLSYFGKESFDDEALADMAHSAREMAACIEGAINLPERATEEP